VARKIRFSMKATVNVGDYEFIHVEHEESCEGDFNEERAVKVRAYVRNAVKKVIEEEVAEARRDVRSARRSKSQR
jgi:hypothetical protein